MDYRKLLLPAVILATCAAAHAQAPQYNLGRAPTAAELKAWDIAISFEGKGASPGGQGLPAGSGTADVGAKIYAEKCEMCHGPNGRGGETFPLVVEPGSPPDKISRPNDEPFATIMWDYIRRAQPLLTAPGTLKPDEVYSLVAWQLYKDGLIKENDVMDAQSLPKVKMPARGLYVSPVWIKPWKP